MKFVRRHRSMGIAAACAVLAAVPLVPAHGTYPVPDSCDPTVATPTVTGCSTVLLGDPGDPLNPSTTYPDLVPDVTEAYVSYKTVTFNPDGSFNYGPKYLFFDTYSQNLGTVPVDLMADDPSNFAGSTVSQCTSWTTNYVCRARAQVGGFVWHDPHTHYHFNDFASYELRKLRKNGTPDFRARGLIATSPKVSFCLIDSQQMRSDANPVPRYDSCTPGQEGISAGWSDIYTSDLDGQTLDIDGLSDGRYAIVIALNPAGHVFESDTTNNRIVVTVELSGMATVGPTATIVDKVYE